MISKEKHIFAFLRLYAIQCLISILLITILFAGCEGPQGSQGRGIDDLDLEPPEIILVTPLAGDTIFTDTLTISAIAQDDRRVEYVEFFIDGISSQGNDIIALDSFPTNISYRYLWDFSTTELGNGIHFLTARAFDKGHNHADTPAIPIWYLPLTGVFEMKYDGAGLLGYLGLPDKSPTQNFWFGDKYFNVRFTPPATCVLKEIRFEFTYPDLEYSGGGIDIDAFVWSSSDLMPDSVLLTVPIQESSMIYDDWMFIDVSEANLEFSSDFHVGFSPVDSLYESYQNEERGASIIISVDPDTLDDARQHRSIEFEPEGEARGWGSMQEHWDLKIDFHIRALVEFNEGQPVLLGSDSDPMPDKMNTDVTRIQKISNLSKKSEVVK